MSAPETGWQPNVPSVDQYGIGVHAWSGIAARRLGLSRTVMENPAQILLACGRCPLTRVRGSLSNCIVPGEMAFACPTRRPGPTETVDQSLAPIFAQRVGPEFQAYSKRSCRPPHHGTVTSGMLEWRSTGE